jgi:hypothetical protein
VCITVSFEFRLKGRGISTEGVNAITDIFFVKCYIGFRTRTRPEMYSKKDFEFAPDHGGKLEYQELDTAGLILTL